MKTRNIQSVVLAAGTSSRFNTGTTKLIVPLCGQELILYPLKALAALKIPQALVVGHNKDLLEQVIKSNGLTNLQFIEQKEQIGTGNALLVSRPTWKEEHILVINGDMPLITSEIIEQLCDVHIEGQNVITFATAHFDQPGGYGRVIKENGTVKIVENRDFTGDVSIDCCINAGIYLFERSFLEEAINNLERHQNSNEFYITDLVKIASDGNKAINTLQVPFDSIRGVNTIKELWACEQIKRAELMSYWMDRGVRFPMAHKVHMEVDVEIGSGSVIESGVQLLKGTRIGKNTTIGPYSIIDNAKIDDNVTIKSHCVIKNSTIRKGGSIGPFAHVHEKSTIDENAIVESFTNIRGKTMHSSESKTERVSSLSDSAA